MESNAGLRLSTDRMHVSTKGEQGDAAGSRASTRLLGKSPTRRHEFVPSFPPLTVEDFIPRHLRDSLRDDLQDLRVDCRGLYPVIKGSADQCKRVMQALMEDGANTGEWQQACHFFCACSKQVRRDLAQSPDFHRFVRILDTKIQDKPSQEMFSFVFRKMVVNQVTEHGDAALLEELLDCCPSWAMPAALKGLAKNSERAVALQEMLEQPGSGGLAAALAKAWQFPNCLDSARRLDQALGHAKGVGIHFAGLGRAGNAGRSRQVG